jgi:hypothetical protein
LDEPHTADEIDIANLEVNSISNLDQGLQIGSLGAMVPLLRAQLLLVKRQWAEADAIYTVSVNGGALRLAPRYLAEQAYCNAMLERQERALGFASEAKRLLTDRTELDDRAACHARLSKSFGSLGLMVESNAHAESARNDRLAFVEFQRELRPRLVTIAEGTDLQR